MSTKYSLFYSDSFHLYREFYDDKSIFLKLNNSKIKIEVEFSVAELSNLASVFNFESLANQANITDEDILKYVSEEVQKRIENKNAINCEFLNFGFLIYGENSLSKEKQIENGMQHFKEKRDYLKILYEQVKSKSNSKFMFGLEDIVLQKTKDKRI